MGRGGGGGVVVVLSVRKEAGTMGIAKILRYPEDPKYLYELQSKFLVSPLLNNL